MFCVAVDDGHGMKTAGKRTPLFPDGSYMPENAYNRAVASYLMDGLKRCGFRVLAVAPGDEDTSLQTRVKRANDAKADAYISIHANAFGSDWNDANGVESWIYEKADTKTVDFGGKVHEALVKACGRKNRGVKKAQIFMCCGQRKCRQSSLKGAL